MPKQILKYGKPESRTTVEAMPKENDKTPVTMCTMARALTIFAISAMFNEMVKHLQRHWVEPKGNEIYMFL